MPISEAAEQLLAELQSLWTKGEFVKLSLSKPIQKADPFKSVLARPMQIKKGLVIGFTHRFATRDEAHNVDIVAALDQMRQWVGHHFLQADVYGTSGSFHLYANRNGTAALLRQAAVHQEKAPLTHNKEKNRLLAPSTPFLHHLGVTSEAGQPYLSKEKKYRQIFQYIEVVGALVREHPLPAGAHVLDGGSGKGYLTFALHDYMVNQLQLDCSMTGLELRPDLVTFCNGVAQRCGYAKLDFVEASLTDFEVGGRIDMLIALHACDTATDLALARGVRDGAQLMVVAPCCQKQVRKEMKGSTLLNPLLKHGLLAARGADWLTDGIRALLLEAVGYRTRVVEFIDLQDTPKNLMLTAVKGAPRPEALEEVQQLKKLFGLETHYLETLLGFSDPV